MSKDMKLTFGKNKAAAEFRNEHELDRLLKDKCVQIEKDVGFFSGTLLPAALDEVIVDYLRNYLFESHVGYHHKALATKLIALLFQSKPAKYTSTW